MTATFTGPATAPPAFAPTPAQSRVLATIASMPDGCSPRTLAIHTRIPLPEVERVIASLYAARLIRSRVARGEQARLGRLVWHLDARSRKHYPRKVSDAVLRERARARTRHAAKRAELAGRLCAREGCGKPAPPSRGGHGVYCGHECRLLAGAPKRYVEEQRVTRTAPLSAGQFPDTDAAADALFRAMHADGGWWGLPKIAQWCALYGIPCTDAARYSHLLAKDGVVSVGGTADCPQWRVL
jgi:hypothetical protein